MKRLIIAALALLTLAQCRHNPAPPAPVDPLSLLPPATQSGERTFGCLVNGKAYATTSSVAVNGDWQSPTTISIGADIKENDGNKLSLGLLLYGKLEENQIFTLIPFNQPINTAVNQVVADAAPYNTNCYYTGNYFQSGGQVKLSRFDGVRRIASGTFAFTLYEPGGCDTLKVTNGRFDIRF